jgi:LPXTG-motif cell wall-anchored protein
MSAKTSGVIASNDATTDALIAEMKPVKKNTVFYIIAGVVLVLIIIAGIIIIKRK